MADKTEYFTIELSEIELGLIRSALDSHVYWQLSDPDYRGSGFVRLPGSDDPEQAEEIKTTEELESRLANLEKKTRWTS